MTDAPGTSITGESIGVGSIGEVSGGSIVVNYYTRPAPTEQRPAGPIPPCPYKGLAFFGPEDADRFFGRDATINQLTAAVEAKNFTALVGASGSGKSSVALAGLAPRLHASGAWRVAYFRIGTETDKNPFRALARALAALSGPQGWAAQLEEIERLADGLASGRIGIANALGAARAANLGRRVLIIADQFEETFTLIADDTLRARFIDLLLGGFPHEARTPPDVALVLTMRADFYENALLHPGLAEALQDRVINLGPMSREDLRAAIERPARPVTFEPGLVETLLDEVETQPGGLPLLQFALTEMWRRLETPQMTRAAYDAIGGVKGALRKRADEIYSRLTHDGADAPATARFRALFARLVNFGEGAADTRRTAGRDELGADVWRLAQDLAGEDTRLVVAGGAPGKETVEFAHEALIGNWPALRAAIDADRAFGTWFKQLRVFLEQHRVAPDDEGGLLRGGPLAVALDWREKRGAELSPEERAFIALSERAKDEEAKRRAAELEERERLVAGRSRSQRIIGFVMIVAALSLVIGMGVAFWKNYEARQLEAQVAEDKKNLERQESSLLGELAHAKLLESDYDAALRLSTKGARDGLALADGGHPAAAPAPRLAEAVWRAGWTQSFGGSSPIYKAAYSPDGARIVTAWFDGTARVFNSATGAQILTLKGHEGPVHAAAFSPDGARVVTASEDKTARIWDAATGHEITTLRGHESAISTAAFSPDGARILTASFDGSARIWDAESGREIRAIRDQSGLLSASFSADGGRIVTASLGGGAHIFDVATANQVQTLSEADKFLISAAFSPDDKHVVTTSSDGEVRTWDVSTGEMAATIHGHTNIAFSAMYSPDGTRVVTASMDKTARVWDAKTGQALAVLRGHADAVTSAVFSVDGGHVLTASADQTARVWDSMPGKTMAVLAGHTGVVNFAAFSAVGGRVLTASEDETARVWDTATGKLIATLRGHESGEASAAFSPDGARVVTALDDKTVRVWDAANGKELVALRGHDGNVVAASFSLDGARVVSASEDKTARVWDAATGIALAVLSGAEDTVRSALFSPDGARVVTTSDDKTARVWDANNGKALAVLRGHEANVASAAFSFDGARVVTASDDKTARVWEAATGRELVVLRGHDSAVYAASFSRDGARVLTNSSDGTARVFDAATGREIAALHGHDGQVLSAAFSADGAYVVTASYDKTARVWDATTGKEIAILRGHDGPVWMAAFSPDGARVVTASDDKTARIWDVRFATMGANGLINEACRRRLLGLSVMTRDEMRLAGYPEATPAIDVCEGVR